MYALLEPRKHANLLRTVDANAVSEALRRARIAAQLAAARRFMDAHHDLLAALAKT